MTKRSKRSGLGGAFDFKRVDPFGARAGEEGADVVADGAAAARTALLHIETMLPDPGQPRRLLPSDLAEALAAGTPPNAVLAEWRARGEAPDAVPFLADHVAEVRQLAESIAAQGLINPVTVREVSGGPSGVRYRLVTGERRWWAHVWLAQEGRPLRDGDGWQDATQIRAAIVPPDAPVRSQQMAENWHRADMAVLDRAYGLWALRRELSGLGDPPATSPTDSAATSEDEASLVPWSAVEEALGISRQHRHRLLKVLELSPPALTLVELHRLPERLLRPVAAQLAGQPEAQVQALRQLITWQAEDDERNMTASAAELARRLKAGSTAEAPSGPPARGARVRQVRSRVSGTLRLLQALEAAEWEALAREVADDARLAEQLLTLRGLIDEALAEGRRGEAP